MLAIDALEKLAAIIRHDNAEKGFDAPSPANIATKLLLVISEICEAQNELRDGHGVTEIYYSDKDGDFSPIRREEDGFVKPEGFPIEIADAIIRILDIQYAMEMEIYLISNIAVQIDQLDNELLYIIHCVTMGGITHNMNIALTRLFLIANAINVDMAAVIDEKLAFNRARPHKHGRTF